MAFRIHTLLLALATTLLVAGCVAEVPGSPDLRVSARWGTWQDQPGLHLILGLRNDGNGDARIGPGGEEVTALGPTSAVPVRWGTPFAQDLPAGGAVTLVLHPMIFSDGTMALTLDHAAGTHAPVAAGLWEICVGDACARTTV